MSLDYIHHTLHMYKAYMHTTQKCYIHVPTQTHLNCTYIHITTVLLSGVKYKSMKVMLATIALWTWTC